MSIKTAIYAWASRRLSPSSQAAIGSVSVTFRRRQLCRVQLEDAMWIHHYRDGIVVQPRLGGATARMIDHTAADTFTYGYVPVLGDVVLDVGAGVGSEVRFFSRLVGETGRVIAFEANPHTFRHLERMISLNQLPNVTALPYAVVEQPGVVLIEDDDVDHLGNHLTDDADRAFSVEGVSLDDMSKELGFDRVDLLKMNIEGAETSALAGMTSLLPRIRNVAISCHDFLAEANGLEWQRTLEPVTSLLIDAGFTLSRRLDDPRPWVRDTVYGTRLT